MFGSLAQGERIRQRLLLTHVHQRSDERLRDRWQRRLDSGEEILCWQCRLRGVRTAIDPRAWHVREDTRTPQCSACHGDDAGQEDPGANARAGGAGGSAQAAASSTGAATTAL